MQPLEGYLVVALEHAVAVPFASRQLADLGARVIKIERRDTGDFARDYDQTVNGQASYFVWLNRGKESVALDIKDTQDRQVLDAVIAKADVLVANLGPGALDRLGLDAATLRADHPDLVHCTVSGYGAQGPFRTKKAYDLLVQCEAGLLSTTGSPEAAAKAGLSIADIAGGMFAYSGILAALLRRERTGEGATLEVAMLDALGEWMTQPALFAAYSGEPPRRTGASHPSIAPYGPFPCGDGQTVFLSVQNDREFAALCRDVLLDETPATDPRFVHNSDRVAHRTELDDLLTQAFSSRTADQVEATLEQVGIANARMRSAEELLTHPQLVARDRWADVEIPGGTTARSLRPPVVVDGTSAPLRPVPELGSHTDALRAELGLDNRTETTT